MYSFISSPTCTDSPKNPHSITLTPGVDGINASWEHDRSCFENHKFEFIVTWLKVDVGDDSENMTVNGTTFEIQPLEPDTNYKICVSAVSISDDKVKSEESCLYKKTGKTYVYVHVDDGGVVNGHYISTAVQGFVFHAHKHCHLKSQIRL